MNMARDTKCECSTCRATVLPLLYDIGRTISECEDLQKITRALLSIMKDQIGVVRGMLTLHHSLTGNIFVHESIGLTEAEEARGVYAIGEGITGKVVESGKPIVLHHIRDESAFLGRTRIRNAEDLDCAFICIPILRGKKVLGTISIEKPYFKRNHISDDVELLTFISAIIAQAVEIYLLNNADKIFLENENMRLQRALQRKFHPDNIIGNSSPMREIYAIVEKISQARATVLILGESGVGKELIANAIHYNSPCANGPFIKFNCSALPESIIESEFFGHEKGAFTGADTTRKGRFEEADGGTIFLDEVGELSLSTQSKLLRVLQERTFERIGSNRPVQVNIRVITATNRDLAAMVNSGRFREDLYYRLCVFPILIPPLRERGDDIIALCDYFITKFAKQNGKPPLKLSTAALQMLLNYHWPGNVRELENVIERAVILCETEAIQGSHLPPSLQGSLLSGDKENTVLASKLALVEYEYLVDALRTARGNTTEAARNLGITRRMLGIRLKKYGLDFRYFRNTQTQSDLPSDED
jgi:Nif-specific regulatory protein